MPNMGIAEKPLLCSAGANLSAERPTGSGLLAYKLMTVWKMNKGLVLKSVPDLCCFI